MKKYIVSARKYRPSTFRSVVGQTVLTTTLKNAIATNHLAHAYLFCGPRGVGKTTCARIFAKTINCFHPTESGEACNECDSCRGFNEQRSFNIHELDAASNNSVEEIRGLIEKVRIPPQVGRYSVYIIDEVHMLSTAAFNAFLKTLEEPPAHAIFILATTEKHRVLATILSRCQIYDFNRITISDMVEHLQYVAQQEGVEAEAEALGVIAQKADGGMRDALSIFDQVVSFCGSTITYQAVIDNLNVLDYEYYFRLITLFLQGDVANSLLVFNEILNKGFDAQNFVQGLAMHFRNLLTATDACTVQLMEVSAEVQKRYIDQSKQARVKFLYQGLLLVNECDLNFKQSKNKRLLVELMLIRLCQLTQTEDSLSEKKNIELSPIKVTPPQVKQSIVQPIEVQKQSATIEGKTIRQDPRIQQKPLYAGSVSILGNRVSNEVEVAKKVEEEPLLDKKQRNATFTDVQFEKCWLEFAGSIQKNAKLTNTLMNFVPKRMTDTAFQLQLVNPVQQKDVQEILPTIKKFLTEKLSNDFLTIEIVIAENSPTNFAYTPEDCWDLMKKNNPVLEELKQNLSLEIL
ncbi:MAG: DNA polymerase III subunit gamma/tau [Paludibacteraceae bacterium]|nr:DNA polymerase III subunit gamma/tau [Paludibacteraceae bacterium]